MAPEACDPLRRLESSLSLCPGIFASSSSKIRMKISRYLKYRAAILGGSSPLQSHALLTGLSWRSHHGAEPNSWAGSIYDHSRSTAPTTVRFSLLRTIKFAKPRSSQISLNLQRSYFALTKSNYILQGLGMQRQTHPRLSWDCATTCAQC